MPPPLPSAQKLREAANRALLLVPGLYAKFTDATQEMFNLLKEDEAEEEDYKFWRGALSECYAALREKQECVRRYLEADLRESGGGGRHNSASLSDIELNRDMGATLNKVKERLRQLPLELPPASKEKRKPCIDSNYAMYKLVEELARRTHAWEPEVCAHYSLVAFESARQASTKKQ